MQYYDVKKHWQKIKHYYKSQEAKNIWYPRLQLYAENRGWDPIKYTETLTPSDFDSCDWRTRYRRAPDYWKYVTHGACFWVVDLNLYLAKKILPDEIWVIVTSSKHALCWNGDDLLFDTNFLALGVPVEEAWKLAACQPDSEILLNEYYFDNI